MRRLKKFGHKQSSIEEVSYRNYAKKIAFCFPDALLLFKYFPMTHFVS